MAEPNAVVDAAEQSELTIEVTRPGRILIRVLYSPWLSVVDENGKSLGTPQETAASKRARERDDSLPKRYANVHGCLMEAAEDDSGDRWTELLAPRAGTYRLAAPVRIPRGTPCPEELR